MLGNRDQFLDRMKPELTSIQMHHCGIQKCSRGYCWEFQARPYHLIHFVIEGSGILRTDGKSTEVREGQAFLIPAGSAGKYRASMEDPWKYAWIGFYADSKNTFLKLLFKKKKVIDFLLSKEELEKNILSIVAVSDAQLESLLAYQEEDFPGNHCFSISSFSASLEANSRMLHLLSRLLETQKDLQNLSDVERNPARDAKLYIDRMYGQSIKIQDVAEAMHIHPNYLSTLFRKEYGILPGNYLRTVRMNQAEVLLALTDYPVAIVAAAVGYSSPFQFSRVFRNYFHVTPTEYRRNHSRNVMSESCQLHKL